MRRRHVLLCLLLSACVPAGDDDGAGPDGGVAVDADPALPDADPSLPDAAGGCPAAPDPSPSWLVSYQRDVVERLAGAAPITADVTLTDRATPAAREHTRDFLLAAFADIGLDAELHTYQGGANVWAELPATDGAEVTHVLGAHFDTVADSPGANDNATGVAIVLAAARYLSALECRSANVVFALFDQEEVGLVGSAEFADMLSSSGVSVASVHTVDQMGWDQDEDRAVELERPDPGLYDLYSNAATAAGLDIPLTETDTGYTDHVSFRERGFDAVGLTEEFVSGDTTPHYHMPSDTADTVAHAYLASTTTLVHAVFAGLLE